MTQEPFIARFFGVRGSIPVPGPGTVRYGGNTSCLEVRCGGETLILDAGTGIRLLGLDMLRRPRPLRASILLSHLHWDHIQGIPFFPPISERGNVFDFYGPAVPGVGLRENLVGQMNHPNFPVPLTEMKAETRFHEVVAGETLRVGSVVVRTAPLRHPGGAMGFRLEYAGRSLAYCCDHEHIPGSVDREVLDLAAGADLLVVDASYTEEEFRNRVGWGHATWDHACAAGKAAGVRRLVLFHHEPGHDDAFLDRGEAYVRERFPGAVFAREGMVFDLVRVDDEEAVVPRAVPSVGQQDPVPGH